MNKTALAILLLAASPASAACHHYSTWRYPFPQACAVRPASYVSPNKGWYVEIKPEPAPKADPRPEQIEDQAEHDAAVAAHRDELNKALEAIELQGVMTMQTKLMEMHR